MLSWLHKTATHLDVYEVEAATVVVTIIENLLNSLDSLTEDTTHYKFLLFNILLQLKEQFFRNTTNDLFAHYVNVFQRVINVTKGAAKHCASKTPGKFKQVL